MMAGYICFQKYLTSVIFERTCESYIKVLFYVKMRTGKHGALL